MFDIYVATDLEDPQGPRPMVEIIHTFEKFITALLSANLMGTSTRKPEVFAERIHRVTHASPDHAKTIC